MELALLEQRYRHQRGEIEGSLLVDLSSAHKADTEIRQDALDLNMHRGTALVTVQRFRRTRQVRITP